MSIGSHKPAVQTRSTVASERQGAKAAGQADAVSTAGHFSALMSFLSANTAIIPDSAGTLTPERPGATVAGLAAAQPIKTSGTFSALMSFLSADTATIDTALPNDTVVVPDSTGTLTGMAPKSPQMMKLSPICPHPDPLPEGEGTISAAVAVTSSPSGGGWGEGRFVSTTGRSGTQVAGQTADKPMKTIGNFSALTSLPPADNAPPDAALPHDTVDSPDSTDASLQMGAVAVLSTPEGPFTRVAMPIAMAETTEAQRPNLSTKAPKSDDLAKVNNAAPSFTDIRDVSEVSEVSGKTGQPAKHTPSPLSGASFAQTLHDTHQPEMQMQSLLPKDALIQTVGGPAAPAGMGDRSTRPSSTKTETGLEGAFVSHFVPTDSLGVDQQVTAASATVPDTAVAETVTYWATQGVQSAELKLDGFGDDPVEVSISMQGDQTQIEFRSDQPDVRLALENATLELRELLADQGLHLAGVSVGSSGRHGTHSDTPRQHTEEKKAVFVKTSVAPTPGRGHASVGRSLDIFV